MRGQLHQSIAGRAKRSARGEDVVDHQQAALHRLLADIGPQAHGALQVGQPPARGELALVAARWSLEHARDGLAQLRCKRACQKLRMIESAASVRSLRSGHVRNRAKAPAWLHITCHHVGKIVSEALLAAVFEGAHQRAAALVEGKHARATVEGRALTAQPTKCQGVAEVALPQAERRTAQRTALPSIDESQLTYARCAQHLPRAVAKRAARRPQRLASCFACEASNLAQERFMCERCCSHAPMLGCMRPHQYTISAPQLHRKHGAVHQRLSRREKVPNVESARLQR